MVDNYGGIIFVIDEPERAQVLEEIIQHDNTFTDAVSGPDWCLKQTNLAFISLGNDNIHYAALCTRGRKVVTRKYALRFTNILAFNRPLPLKEIEEHLEVRFRQYLIRSSSGTGSRVPTRTWQKMFETVKKLEPELADELDRLQQQRKFFHRFAENPGSEIILQERDAVNLALRFAGMDPRKLLLWNPGNEPAPFLQGLDTTKLTEDQIIAHDSQVFDNWLLLGNGQGGVAVFTKGSQRLTIMNVNRHQVEHSLGVDLLYYSEHYHSYVLVQYKRMTGKEGRSGYRPTNDSSYKAEIQRMNQFNRLYPINITDGTIYDYRLNPGAFYFKVCSSITTDPTSTEMIKGMYLPLDYWEILVDSPSVLGPRQGIIINYENVGRYLSNQLFVELVQSGWIGSRITQTDALTELIKSRLKVGNSVTVAINH